MQRHVLVDGKVRTDKTYPASFMEVVSIPKTNENFCLLCDTKGQFRLHSIRDEEAKFKLCKVRSVQFGQKGIPYLNTFDGRTIRYPDPLIKANNTIKLDLESQKITEFIKFNVGHEFTTRLGNVFTIGKGTKPWVSLTKGKGIKLPSLKKPGRGLEPKQYPQHKILCLNKRRKTLEREVAHAKVTANCVSAVLANEWKDANDKVMPVKQWLEERKIFQGEMQQLHDKLAVAMRTTKAEAQLKEKHQMQFKVLEERLKTSNGNSCIASEGRTISNGSSRHRSLGGAENFSKSSSNHWMDKLIPDASGKDNVPTNTCAQNLISKTNGAHMESANGTPIGNTKPEHEDYVSGMLYDMLQKEVVSLRKACNERDQTLKDKDDAIEMLAKKVNTLNKAMEVEAKKMRREVAAIRVSKEHDQRMRCISTPRGAVNSSHLTSARKARNP